MQLGKQLRLCPNRGRAKLSTGQSFVFERFRYWRNPYKTNKEIIRNGRKNCQLYVEHQKWVLGRAAVGFLEGMVSVHYDP